MFFLTNDESVRTFSLNLVIYLSSLYLIYVIQQKINVSASQFLEGCK
jgi:hypothetical protein